MPVIDCIKNYVKNRISLYLCRHRNVQDFFVARRDEINLNGFDAEKRTFYDVNNEEDFYKLCDRYNFSVPDADIKKRFSEGAHFCMLAEDDHYGCWGWYSVNQSDFYVLEIDRVDSVPENSAVLFHYYSNPDYRRCGFYYDLLRNVALKNGADFSVIYAYDTNPASSNAIKKAGFKFAGRMGHKNFVGFEEIIRKAWDRNMKSILFFIESLDGGGAEGALENVVTNLNKDLFDISVVSETDNERRTERIAAVSNYHCFGHKNLNHSIPREIINRLIFKFSWTAPPWLVRETLIRGKYDIEVAGCEGYATKIIANSKDKNSKKIAWVHTDFVNNPWSKSVYKSADEERACYEKFDAIICASQTIRDSFVQTYGMEEKVKVLYNIVDNHRIQKLGSEPVDFTPKRPMFIQAGSFLRVKGYDRAVRAYGKLRDNGFDFSAMIMGIGYERDKIEKLIDELNLRDRITLMDYQPNPYKYMATADAYVCSSYAEGYSTTVTESVILGTPIITTECSGMREIFGDRECGIICENSEEGLYNALKTVLENPSLLEKFRKETEIRSEYFSKENLVEKIETLFKTI